MRILALLLTVGLVLGLSAFVMSSLDSQDPTKHGTGVQVLPGGVVVADPGGDGAVPSGGPVDAAHTVACATEAQALRGAEDQYKALHDRYADVATLVSEQVLRRASTLYRVESDDGFVTFRLVGLTGCP